MFSRLQCCGGGEGTAQFLFLQLSLSLASPCNFLECDMQWSTEPLKSESYTSSIRKEGLSPFSSMFSSCINNMQRPWFYIYLFPLFSILHFVPVYASDFLRYQVKILNLFKEINNQSSATWGVTKLPWHSEDIQRDDNLHPWIFPSPHSCHPRTILNSKHICIGCRGKMVLSRMS
jgi:hypothetical protein